MKYKVLVKFKNGTSVEYMSDTKPSYSFDVNLRKSILETYGIFSCVAEDVLYFNVNASEQTKTEV